MKNLEEGTRSTIEVDGIAFRFAIGRNNYAGKKSGQLYAHVTAPDHGLVMGSLKYLGKNPSQETMMKRIKAECKWHIKVKNVTKN